MCRAALFFVISLLIVAPARAEPVEDATAAVTSVLDKFNAGDIDAFFAAHQDGAVIVDEFEPYLWSGPGSVQRWAADYMRDAEKRGISGGRMDYAAPIQATSNGTSAYLVLPTTYSFIQNGRKMASKANMTFIMTRRDTIWKITSWTYGGATPSPQ